MRRFGLFLFAILAILSVAATTSQAQSVMTHHVREVTRNGQALALGQLPANQTMTLDIVLPLSDPAGLKIFLSELYNPTSPSYRHFLTVPEFTAKFGPSQADYDAVVLFAQMNGLTVVGGSRDGMDVQVKGPVSAIQNAFHVSLATYQHPTEGRTFYAPDREPTTYLPFSLWHISGLDNYSLPHPMLEKKSDYAKAHGIDVDAVVSHATTGSGPSASFLGSDMRAAYYGGTALTGAGQNLGLFEYLGTDLADLNTYFKNVGQTNNVPITLLSTDGTSTSCVDTRAGGNCDDTEQTLDMTQAIGMAPGLASLVMYIGSTDTAIISAMTTHSPLPTTIGCSWGWTPADPSTLDPYFQRMAAQGQNFFAASGDSSTWSSRVEAWPADDANVVSVGGTDLVTTGAGAGWASETAWSDSGGGISPDKIAIPSWQQLSGVITSSNRGSTTLSQRPGRICERELYLLHLRRPDGLPRQRIRRHQLRRSNVGRLHCARQSAVGHQQSARHRLHQPDDLRPERDLQLRHGLPRHHQRHLRQLFSSDRLRSGDRMGQSERWPDRCTHWIDDTNPGLHALCVAHGSLSRSRQQWDLHNHHYSLRWI